MPLAHEDASLAERGVDDAAGDVAPLFGVATTDHDDVDGDP